jgi:hypothetical protein
MAGLPIWIEHPLARRVACIIAMRASIVGPLLTTSNSASVAVCHGVVFCFAFGSD